MSTPSAASPGSFPRRANISRAASSLKKTTELRPFAIVRQTVSSCARGVRRPKRNVSLGLTWLSSSWSSKAISVSSFQTGAPSRPQPPRPMFLLLGWFWIQYFRKSRLTSAFASARVSRPAARSAR